MRGRSIYLLIALPFVVAMTGCSISTSVSESIASPFRLLSDSSASSSGGRKQAYEDDVADYTATFARSQGDFDKFRDGLSSLASKHGISNWEADQGTYEGIGRGLRRASVSTGQLEAYKTNLSAGDPKRADGIQKGYDSGR